MTDIGDLARRFQRFAELECRGSSPLYERLAIGVSTDVKVLEIATHCAKGQPAPNLFFGAAHLTLLKGERHPVSAFYPNIADADAPGPDTDPYPHFKDFCLRNRQEIIETISTRTVQTNEVGRCAALLPVFAIVSSRAPDKPFAFVEVGASAGLNLLWDYFRYDYGPAGLYGHPNSPVRLSCDSRGASLPDIPQPFPEIGLRVGIDLNPIDLNDPDAALWLRALIWPEHTERVAALTGALEIARQHPPTLIAGDALDALPGVLEDVDEDMTLCVFHTHTLNQFPPEARERFASLVDQYGARRDLYVVSIERQGPQRERAGALAELTAFEGGEKRHDPLATCDNHGRWLEWL